MFDATLCHLALLMLTRVHLALRFGLVAEEPSETLPLVRQAQAGNRSAFDQLVKRNAARLLNLITAKAGRAVRADCDADDIFQKVIWTAWELVPRYQHVAAGSFYRWLVRLALNKLSDEMKYLGAKGRAEVRHLESGSGSSSSDRRTPVDSAMTASALAAFREQSTRVDDALQLLEVEIRAVVELRYREGLKVRDIGKHLGIAPSTAMKRLQNGLRELKGLLGPLD